MTETDFLAHVGELGTHDMWVVVPMALVSAVLLVVLARPKPPASNEDPEVGDD